MTSRRPSRRAPRSCASAARCSESAASFVLQRPFRRIMLSRAPGGAPGMSTRLTAMDVAKQDFTRKMRGFDADEVTLFLKAVAEEIERLNLENQTLTEEAATLRTAVDDFNERERELQETLITAQRMSSDLKHRSKAEADLLVREARVKAERVLEQAQDQLHAIENEIGRLRLEKDAFENRLRSAIEEHLSLLDLRRQEKADVDNLRFLRRRSTTDVG